MLLELSRWLADSHFSAFGVVEYITFRALLACATALLIGLVAGPFVIRKLTELKIGQAVRAYGPESHLQKNGTPTMGGGSDSYWHRRQHLAMGRLVQPFRLGCVAGYLRLRLDRLGGRLQKSGAPRSGGHVLAPEIFLAGNYWSCGCGLFKFCRVGASQCRAMAFVS